MPCNSIVSNTKVNVTRISSIYESTDRLESDSLKEVQRESTQSDDSVMDDTGKENLISQKSEEVDMEVGGSVIGSGVVIASAVQVPILEISIPSKQGLKLKNNLKKQFLRGRPISGFHVKGCAMSSWVPCTAAMWQMIYLRW